MRIYRSLKTTVLCGLSIFLFLICVVPGSDAGSSEELDSIYVDEVNMIKGELITMKVYDMTRVSVTNPEIADIAEADAQEILLVGKRTGQTALFIWDEHGKRTVMVYVFNQNLDLVKSRIKKLFKAVNIYEVQLDVNEQEGKVVLLGEVPEDKREQYDQVVGAFADDIINLVRVEKSYDLVQVDMQITELNTTLSKSLGIDWTTGGASGIAPKYEETQYSSDGHIRDFFKIGEFNRTGQLVAAVNALITEGKARILSKPKIVVISGEEASFLVGGEIPIRTTTFSDTGSSQENVQFKEFGISMTITPTIKKEKIDVVMNLEVSEIDASTASTVSEEIAFSTRSASTHLYLDNGQTIVLAGLIRHQESQTLSKIPFIGDIPILGLLFRSRVNPVPETDQELVIALTPHILRQAENVVAKKASADNASVAAYRAPGAALPSYQRAVPYYLGIPKEMTGYVYNVQQRISQAIVYPPEAQRYGWEGTVKVGMLILNDGTLAFALVKESSGRNVFDEVALNTAKNLAPFSAFPSDTDLQELNVTIPIVYSLNKN